MKLRYLPYLLPIPLIASPKSIAPTMIFEEIDGVLTVEAEHFRSQTLTEKRAWHIVTTDQEPGITPDGDPNHAATASGGAYLEILPDTRRSHGDKLIQGENFTNKPGEMAVLTYKAYFHNAGRYYCWVRTHSTNTEDNGIHLGIDGTWPESGARMQWTAKNKWHWDSKQRTQKKHTGVFGKIWIEVDKPGLHNIHFSMREDGFEFDQFVLTKEKPNPENPPKSEILKTPPKKLAKAPSLKMDAFQFNADHGYYMDQDKWLAVHPDQKTAHTTTSFPHPSGRYDLSLLAVGENDGMAPHEVLINDVSVLKFSTPLAEKKFDASPRFHGTVKNIEINLGDVIVIKSAVHSADGKEYSRARFAGLTFTPADAATIAKQKPLQKKATAKKKLPDLQEPRFADGDGSIEITGALTQWQPINLTLDGPFAHELDNKPNPFRDHNFLVVFSHSSGSPTYTVPGYFAADGNAAETSATSGTKWRAHVSPDKPGTWTYHTLFGHADDIAKAKLAGTPYTPHPAYSQSGSFEVKAAPSDAPGFYGEGRLTYVGKHIPQLSGSKRFFLKAGADAPETLLAYKDFDGTINHKKNLKLKTWGPHIKDWKEGDPTWKDGKGKGLIGALNYLAGKGMNAFSFLPYNAGGDGDNVWPFVSRNDKFHYDCSKLDQWNIVFDHAQKLGLFLHFKLQETEMDDNNRGHNNSNKIKIRNVPTSLDNGDLGPERKLYLRELVARFGHHLALNWNIGEENTQTTKQQLDMANELRRLDPYDHHLVIHTYPDQQDNVYRPLLGTKAFTGASLQNSHLKDCHWQVVKWNRESAKAGKPWGVAFDEPGNASHGMPADPDYPGMPKDYKGATVDETRKHVLWGSLMAGGWGVEYYFGYKLPQSDLNCEDWRSRDQSWDYAKIALDFFRNENVPFWEMASADEMIGNPKHQNFGYCLAKKGYYVVYLDGSRSVVLTPHKGDQPNDIQWFNPRTGEKGPRGKLGTFKIEAPTKDDWVAIIQ